MLSRETFKWKPECGGGCSMLVAWFWAILITHAFAIPQAAVFNNGSNSTSSADASCGKCGIEAPGGIRLVFWEPDSAAKNDSNITTVQSNANAYTRIDNGFTYTSPSIYVIYSSLRATATCSGSGSAHQTVGPSFSAKTIAYSSRFLAYGTLSSPDGSCSEHVVVDGFHTIDFNSLYYNPIAPTTTTKAGCAPYVNPRLSLPADLTTVDPAWQSCEPLFFGAFDPPSVLRKASNRLAPSSVAGGRVTGGPAPPWNQDGTLGPPKPQVTQSTPTSTIKKALPGSSHSTSVAVKTPVQKAVPQQTGPPVNLPVQQGNAVESQSIQVAAQQGAGSPANLGPQHSPSSNLGIGDPAKAATPVQHQVLPPADLPNYPQRRPKATTAEGTAKSNVATLTSSIILVPVPVGPKSSPKASSGDAASANSASAPMVEDGGGASILDGGSDTKGSDTKGSDTTGSDHKGSNTEDSGTTGLKTIGTGTKKAKEKDPIATSNSLPFVPGAKVQPASTSDPKAVPAGGITKPEVKLMHYLVDGQQGSTHEKIPVGDVALGSDNNGLFDSPVTQSGHYDLPTGLGAPDYPHETVTLKGGKVTPVPIAPSLQTTYRNGIITIISISTNIPHRTVTLWNGQVTAIPVINASGSNSNKNVSAATAITASGSLRNPTHASTGFLKPTTSPTQLAPFSLPPVPTTASTSHHHPSTSTPTSRAHHFSPDYILLLTLLTLLFLTFQPINASPSPGNNIWITSTSLPEPQITQQRMATGYNAGYGGGQDTILGQNTATLTAGLEKPTTTTERMAVAAKTATGVATASGKENNSSKAGRRAGKWGWRWGLRLGIGVSVGVLGIT